MNGKYSLEKMFNIRSLIREMPIKTTVGYHCTPINMSKIIKTDHTT